MSAARFAFAALSVASIAAPASAQIGINGVGQAGGTAISRQLERLRDRIETARDEDRLSRDQARALRREARTIDSLERRYAAGGLSEPEAAELQFRASALSGSVLAPQPAPGPSGR